MSLRDHVWHILNDPEDPRYSLFLWFVNALILTSVGLLVYETFYKPQGELAALLRDVDNTILAVFLIEYVGRLWVIRDWKPTTVKLTRTEEIKHFLWSRLRFIFTPWGLIDFLALLPLVPFLRSLRVLRLLRLFRSVQLFRYSNPLTTLLSGFRDNALLFGVAFGFVLVCVLLGAVMFFFAEYGTNTKVTSLADTLWWSIVTITTVGFGDIYPETPGGRVIGAALMIAGMFVIAMFAGVISSTLVDQLMPIRQEQVRMSSTTDHIIIAGWNDNVPMLLAQLEADLGKRTPPILVFAPLDRPEALDPKHVFVHGDFTKEAEYEKVRLRFARTVVVVSDATDRGARPAARDASTVLTVFTIRRLERTFQEERTRPIHICAEILDPENVEHASVAGADEVLATALVGNSLLAHTAGNPGVGHVLNDLLLATRNNIYTSPIPVSLIEGKTLTFDALQKKLRAQEEILVIGVVHGGKMVINPDPEAPVFVEDQIIYIGDRQLG